MQSHMTWVRKYACTTDLNGGQCIADDEVLTHHTSEKGSYNNAPRPEVMEGMRALNLDTLVRIGQPPWHPVPTAEGVDMWEKYEFPSVAVTV